MDKLIGYSSKTSYIFISKGKIMVLPQHSRGPQFLNKEILFIDYKKIYSNYTLCNSDTTKKLYGMPL